MRNYGDLQEKLAIHGQEHLLHFWNDLSEDEQKHLVADIEEINLEEVCSFFKRANTQESGEKLDDRLQPVPESQYMSINRTSAEKLKIYENEGLKQISAGHVGVLLMAGGQGTRLGFSHPKVTRISIAIKIVLKKLLFVYSRECLMWDYLLENLYFECKPKEFENLNHLQKSLPVKLAT